MFPNDLSSLWRSRLEQCKSSGMTVKAWCETQGCSLNQYYYWKRRFSVSTANLATPSQWVQVNVVETDTTPAINLYIGQARIEVQQGFNPTLLQEVVAAIGRTSC